MQAITSLRSHHHRWTAAALPSLSVRLSMRASTPLSLQDESPPHVLLMPLVTLQQPSSPGIQSIAGINPQHPSRVENPFPERSHCSAVHNAQNDILHRQRHFTPQKSHRPSNGCTLLTQLTRLCPARAPSNPHPQRRSNARPTTKTYVIQAANLYLIHIWHAHYD